MEAVILAAGIARRLRPYMDDHPKCLLSFDGRTLMERHLSLLASLGVPRATIVTGHMAEQIEAPSKSFPGIETRFVQNERFDEGSILSMQLGLRALSGGSDALLMDADVLYEPEILRRLVDARGSCFLMDETSAETGEEMMLGARAGRVLTIARRVGDAWDEVGEGVGFFRIERAAVGALLNAADVLVNAGETRVEYEAAIDRFLKSHRADYVRVGGLAWTEIDFPEDVERAEREILPIIRAREAALGRADATALTR